MTFSERPSGYFTTFTTQRVATGGRPTDEFDVKVTLSVGSESLTGLVRVSRDEEDRIYRYFQDIQRVTVEIDGPVMVIVLDPGVEPMPAFRLLPSPVTTR